MAPFWYLGGSGAKAVLLVVILRVGFGFIVLGAGAGVFATWGPNLVARDGTLVVGAGLAPG